MGIADGSIEKADVGVALDTEAARAFLRECVALPS